MSETLIQTPDVQDERLEVSLDRDAPCTAELAECTCPDFCERDHDNE
jgi:hypothetical protein